MAQLLDAKLFQVAVEANPGLEKELLEEKIGTVETTYVETLKAWYK